jgi:hypothetical protein
MNELCTLLVVNVDVDRGAKKYETITLIFKALTVKASLNINPTLPPLFLVETERGTCNDV